MEIKSYNLLNVGVGGQGVIRAAQILSYAALLEKYKIRTAETHGMAQRGGSVASYLRFGTEVEGPLIPRGRTDTILAFEASEAVRIFNYAGPETIFLINENIIVPPVIHQMGMNYYYEITKAMLEDLSIDIVVPCLVIPPFLEMKSDEHFRGMIRAWNETKRLKPMVPLVFFGENFNELNELAKKEKAPVFHTPTEAAYSIKVLIDRMKLKG